MTVHDVRTLLTTLALGLAFAASARADTIVIDDSTAGTVIDGILDGFPFPPPGLAPDGIGDFAGNAMAVALQPGVTEERGIVELPLAPLAGLASSDIATATLTFNIDDVIGTFGPGTTFSGVAASTIVLFRYAGNGVIDLADFGNVAGAPLAVVDTTSHGVITDATLAVTGPLFFHVDVTAALRALLDGHATHMGIVFTTTDAGTATSIDNLGFSGAGPAGVNGSRMPYLTVATVASEPPTYDKLQLGCQAAISKGGAKLTRTLHGALVTCLNGALRAAAEGGAFGAISAKCAAALAPADPGSKVGKAIAQLTAAIAKKCAGLLPIDLGTPCSPSAASFADVASCIAGQHRAQVSTAVAAEYATACAVITAVGLDGTYPALCGN
ncbi:hypothetical protein KF840_18105 [bacterium]|nr:hypothetical protein [bacterium]